MLIRFAKKFAPLYAEDLVHDVFLRIWGSSALDLPENELRRILFTSVRNACMDYLRRLALETKTVNFRKMQLQMDELAFAEDVENLFIREDMMHVLMRKIDELPETGREIFLKSYIDGMKAADIAEQMNLSVRTVENHLYRSLLTLRRYFSHFC